MATKVLRVAGQTFRLIPEAEFRALRKQAKAGAISGGRKSRSTRSGTKSLQELNDWMSANWDEVVRLAKANTKRLTGREVL